MDAISRKNQGQLEINDLLAEAVVNAEARRNQAEESLSDEQTAAVKGGLSINPIIPIVMGIIYVPRLPIC